MDFMAPGVVVLGVLVALAGCSPFGGGSFACERDDQCVSASGPGVCEPTGFCSFLDDGCPSGRRYGDSSGPDAGKCVGDGGSGDDGGFDSPVVDTPGEAFCSLTEPALVGCWQFENDLADGSPFANTGTGTGAITYATGKVGLAVGLDASSHVAVADSASLSKPAISIEAWINPSEIPATRFGILDNNNSYGFFLLTGGVLRCTVSVTVTTAAVITAGQWTHVACTYDGTTGRVYVNGIESAMMGGGSALGAGDASGTALGGNSPTGESFVGALDQLRVFDTARTAAQICAASGNPSC